MGALGNLTRKVKRRADPAKFARQVLRKDRIIMDHLARSERRPATGFYAGLTDEQKRLVMVAKDGSVQLDVEMSRAELEERSTVGEIQPSHPQRYESHGHETKGRIFNGECNRSACDNWRATYYNVMTYSYYCRPCGWAINEAPQGRGKPICIEVTENLTHERMDYLYQEQYR
ncbi:hypothetical protein B7L88_gp129 [Rhizobium phage RHEph10]|uniref:hypothetical protein n=1 Tax=Rhizobium phage RHEph10 TaxID=1220717 RepID=UPI0002AB01EB|nr:hypothetical protein B7L88_gp129 [Rhizobium phage RHEph10]AGC36159.1 hypothetical protein RHEph10_gp116 [Rhizobium phage RHEph10]